MKLTGKKTYAVALSMAILGGLFLLAAGQATWEDPTQGIEAAVRRVVGWLLITQAAGIASLRHAIYTNRSSK